MKALHKIFLIGSVLALLLPRSGFAAEAKPGGQTAWEKTIEAAKKEGRLNFYVGRYGSEPLLEEFRKEFPWMKLVTVNGSGNHWVPGSSRKFAPVTWWRTFSAAAPTPITRFCTKGRRSIPSNRL
jgi:hypothetical protein